MREIEPNFGADPRYAGTIFEGLKITDLRGTSFATPEKNLGNDPLFGLAVQREYRLRKGDGTPDWRYHSRDRLWFLSDFIARLERAVTAGDVIIIPDKEEHELFSVAAPASNAHSGLVIRNDAAYFGDWPFEPVYRRGGYPDFVELVGQLVRIGSALQTS